MDALATMPVLRELYINLHEEEQVDYLLRTLADLAYLNGLAVERDALFEEGTQEEGVVVEEEEEDIDHTDRNEVPD